MPASVDTGNETRQLIMKLQRIICCSLALALAALGLALGGCFTGGISTSDGTVVGGYYGKIYRDVSFKSGPYGNTPVDSVEMEYYLNPTAYDRNLEFNKKSLSRCPNNRWWEWH